MDDFIITRKAENVKAKEQCTRPTLSLSTPPMSLKLLQCTLIYHRLHLRQAISHRGELGRGQGLEAEYSVSSTRAVPRYLDTPCLYFTGKGQETQRGRDRRGRV